MELNEGKFNIKGTFEHVRIMKRIKTTCSPAVGVIRIVIKRSVERTISLGLLVASTLVLFNGINDI